MGKEQQGRDLEQARAWDPGRDDELEARIEEMEALAEEQRREVEAGNMDESRLRGTNAEIERLQGMQAAREAAGGEERGRAERGDGRGDAALGARETDVGRARGAHDIEEPDEDRQDGRVEDRLEERWDDPQQEVRDYIYADMSDEDRDRLLSRIEERDPVLARELPFERADELAARADETHDPQDVQAAVRAYKALPWDQKLDFREHHEHSQELERALDAEDRRELREVEQREGPIQDQAAGLERDRLQERGIQRTRDDDEDDAED